MKKSLFLPILLTTTLVGCSSPLSSTWVPPSPGAIDKSVQALLPKGSYTLTGALNKNGATTFELKGYVNFGSSSDGIDCAADYVVREAETSENTTDEFSMIHVLRTKTNPSWYRDVSNPSNLGDWFDNSDPSAPKVALLFWPAFFASDSNPGVVEGAGTGEICSIPVISRFMSFKEDRLYFDKDRAIATLAAGRARWNEKFVDAIGFTGFERDKYIKDLVKLTKPDTSNSGVLNQITKDFYLTLTTSPNGVVEIREFKKGLDDFEFSLILTPSSERKVDGVVGVKSYFEKVRAEVKKSGLTPREFFQKASNKLES